MARVRVKDSSRPDQTQQAPQSVPLRPLHVAGVVVHKSEVIDALRVYVPGLTDISVTEDGDYFWLMLAGPSANGIEPAS